MRYSWLIVTIILVSSSTWAAESNFGKLILARDFQPENARVRGYTGGSYSLLSIANQDSRNSPCLGYGDNKPDHTMVLKNNFEYLKIVVDSGGKDTTLLIKGKDKILCGDDTDNPPDASIEARNWRAGTYEIWVGSIEPNQRWQYVLSVEE
jgi:hypothetical protein